MMAESVSDDEDEDDDEEDSDAEEDAKGESSPPRKRALIIRPDSTVEADEEELKVD